MADINQNVNYEITAQDKTGEATDSALANLIRQYFGGNGSVQCGSIADHRIHMRNLTNGFFQIRLLDFV